MIFSVLPKKEEKGGVAFQSSREKKGRRSNGRSSWKRCFLPGALKYFLGEQLLPRMERKRGERVFGMGVCQQDQWSQLLRSGRARTRREASATL